MNLREILFIGCVVLVLTVCALGFIGSFFRSPQSYESVDINSLRLPAGMTGESGPSVVPSEYVTLEKKLPEPERRDNAPVVMEKVVSVPPTPVAPIKELMPAPSRKKTLAEPERRLVVKKRLHAPEARTAEDGVREIELAPASGKAQTASSSADRRLVYYVVRRGDSLFSISRAFGVGVADIAKDNKLDPDGGLLAENRLVLFVSARMISGGSQIQGRDYEVSHLVLKGESLSMIARAYGVGLGDVIRANKDRVEDINVLVEGQELIVPVNNG